MTDGDYGNPVRKHQDAAAGEAVEISPISAQAIAAAQTALWEGGWISDRTDASFAAHDALAAAVPLIVADRDATIRACETTIAGLDAEVDRLTAERDAALALPEKIAAAIGAMPLLTHHMGAGLIRREDAAATARALAGGGGSDE
jgi:hypothetical protein